MTAHTVKAKFSAGMMAALCSAAVFSAVALDAKDTAVAPATADAKAPAAAAVPAKPGLDTSGKKKVGKASFYATRFAGHKMADGARMDSHSDNAASKTLPLGTTAKVTNLDTGKSTVVTIQDRGPYASGRIVDLSPSTAAKIGITKTDGVAKVEVAPIAVPLANGGVKLGAAVTDPKTAEAAKGSEHSNW